jgi:hypothetical protein
VLAATFSAVAIGCRHCVGHCCFRRRQQQQQGAGCSRAAGHVSLHRVQHGCKGARGGGGGGGSLQRPE